jgi:hypothetical protein
MCLRKKIGPDPRNFNQRVSLGRNDLLIRTFPMIFVKHGKVIVVLSNISMINMIHISFMVLSFMASGPYSQYQKLNGLYSDRQNQLSVMYAFEYLIESALTESERTTSNDIMLTVKYASDSDFNFIEDNIDSRCCYFISLSPEQRKSS